MAHYGVSRCRHIYYVFMTLYAITRGHDLQENECGLWEAARVKKTQNVGVEYFKVSQPIIGINAHETRPIMRRLRLPKCHR